MIYTYPMLIMPILYVNCCTFFSKAGSIFRTKIELLK